MRWIEMTFLGLAAIILASCADEKRENNGKPVVVREAEENFDWLTGEWQRINEEEGRETFEFWLKKNNGAYLGIGYTMEGEDTIWYEEMALVEEGDVWKLNIIGEEDSLPTSFELTAVEKQSFTSKNAQNEFPKQIRYSLKGETLEAIISGGGQEIPFVFVRAEE